MDIRAALSFMVVVSAVVLPDFAVHDLIRFGIASSTAASRAPEQFWDSLGDSSRVQGRGHEQICGGGG